MTHRATSFEIFIDLVFVFALIRIDAFMAQPLTPTTLVRGLVLLLLLWFAFEAYIWLANQTRVDVGLVRAYLSAAMAAILVAALAIPVAWLPGNQNASGALTLALARIVIRGGHLALFYYVSAGDQRPRRQVRVLAIPATVGWIPPDPRGGAGWDRADRTLGRRARRRRRGRFPARRRIRRTYPAQPRPPRGAVRPRVDHRVGRVADLGVPAVLRAAGSYVPTGSACSSSGPSGCSWACPTCMSSSSIPRPAAPSRTWP